MKKDLFIDNNIACKFSNPQDKEYIKLTKWLLDFDPSNPEHVNNKDNYAHLVVSKKILVEYSRSAQGALSDTSMPMIIDQLQKDGRRTIIKSQETKDFKGEEITLKDL